MRTQGLMRFAKQRLLLTMTGGLLVFGGSAFAQPANDNCATATVIPPSAPPYTDSVDTTTATLDPADPLLSCNTGDDGNNTVWYEWTPATSGLVNITTDGSTDVNGGELDTAHGMYTGSCGALVEYACVDIGLNDDLVVEVEAGTTYRIKVGEFAGGVGGGNLVLSVEPPPEPEQFVIESSRDGISPPISSLVGAGAALSAEERAELAPRIQQLPNLKEIPNLMPEAGSFGPTDSESASSSGSAVPTSGRVAMKGSPRVVQSFEGGENDDNAFVLFTLIAPPDTVGDVGRTHYVQMFNLLTEIFDKSGNSVLGPFPTSVFFTGLGGPCEAFNLGDPIVIYDEETDRWLVSQFQGFSAPGFQLCVAVSETGDPTGRWFQYEYEFGGIGFPDYPKYGFATDSIGLMANMFIPFQGAGLGVIDKAEAMQPGPASMVFFVLGPTEFGFLPGDNDGPSFGNVPPTFFTNNGGSGDSIDVWEISPDFEILENSTVGEVASLDVTPYDSDICPAPRERCIDQPGSGTGGEVDPRLTITSLEAISSRLMHRAQMRSYGDDEDDDSDSDDIDLRAVLNHTVDADGNGTAGIRWYDVRNKGRGWKVKKENTYSPDGDNRWMGSIATTKSGDTCLGYSISSQTTYPSIGVAGRRGNAKRMNVREAVVFDGNAAANVQRQTARWGDYSSMNIDPVDDTCWYTTEYAKPNSFIGERFGWATQIVQFDVDDDDDDSDSD